MNTVKFTEENIKWLKSHGFTEDWNGFVRIKGDIAIKISAYKNIFSCDITHKQIGFMVTASNGGSMENAIEIAKYKCFIKLNEWLEISNFVKEVFDFNQ